MYGSLYSTLRLRLFENDNIMKAGFFELDSAADATKTASNNDNVVNVTHRCRPFGGLFGERLYTPKHQKQNPPDALRCDVKRAPIS